jgi:hypothetical protein
MVFTESEQPTKMKIEVGTCPNNQTIWAVGHCISCFLVIDRGMHWVQTDRLLSIGRRMHWVQADRIFVGDR